MEVHPTCVEGAFVIQGIAFEDERGSFQEIFNIGKLPLELPLSAIQQVSTKLFLLVIREEMLIDKCVIEQGRRSSRTPYLKILQGHLGPQR